MRRRRRRRRSEEWNGIDRDAAAVVVAIVKRGYCGMFILVRVAAGALYMLGHPPPRRKKKGGGGMMAGDTWVGMAGSAVAVLRVGC